MINARKEHISPETGARPGEIVFFKDGVYKADEIADIHTSIPKAMERLAEMDYEVVGITVYQGNIRLLLHPRRRRKKAQPGDEPTSAGKTKREKFAEYMRRRYWKLKHGCEPPEKKGERRKEEIE